MSSPLLALEHDVAKYIVRTARNLPEGPIPKGLRSMLIRDLYGREGEAGPSQRFEEHAAALDAARRDQCVADFRRLSELEVQVRGGENDATHEAITLARSIAARIHEAKLEQP
ncbi:MAG: hypothetical protein ACI9KE_003295 [Polyangiales bacterium]|jgi:hypothetical protein